MDSINVIDQAISDRYALYNGDSAEILKGIPSDSVHFSTFSPPFAEKTVSIEPYFVPKMT